MERIRVPESRKVQMVVVATREEAEDLKRRIEGGELTMYQAAQQYSLDPTAKQTLGEMGWVSPGTGFEEIDDYTFGLEPEAIGGPVESPAGWHLIKVQAVTDAQYEDIGDAGTRQRTLRLYMKSRLDDYVVELRKERFEVAVYEDELASQFQREADYIAELNERAAQPDSVTRQRQQELQQWIGTPRQ
jgi:hypothetical protein